MFKVLLTIFCIILISYLTVTMPKMLRAGKGPMVRLSMFLVMVVVMILIIIKLL